MSDGSTQGAATGARKIKLHMDRTEAKHQSEAAALHKAKSELPKPTGWFGSFSEGESTFSDDGVLSHPDNPEFYVQFGGKDPSVEYPIWPSDIVSAEYFHESQSAGAQDAWQAHSPAAGGSISGNRNIRNGKWMYTPNGWVQNYVTQQDDPLSYTGQQPPKPIGIKEPAWFDNKVQQYDGFGRFKLPRKDSGFFFAERGWQERSVNTTLACKEPGCIANVSIQAFDGAKEEATNCRLTVNVHPTDYDDDWSQEVVEYIKVNGAAAVRSCNPKARGCNATADKPLFPCLVSLDVDDLVDPAGTIVVEGKISTMVDECPYSGNLLSGVVMVTCMVRPPTVLLEANATTSTTTTTTPAQALTAQVALQCNYPGCVAKSLLKFSPALVLHGGKCIMSVNVTQTDFDDKLGLPEDVEFIAVEGKNATTKPVSPGKNPCTAEYEGKPLKDEEKIFNVLKEYDVTDQIKEARPIGTLTITGKISPQVDECGSNGHLLDGIVLLECTPPTDSGSDDKKSLF